MDLGTKQSKASKGPSVHKCPISLSSSTTQLTGENMLFWLIITWEICRVKACISFPNDFPRKGGKGHQTFKSFSCKWWSAKFTAWSSIIWILIRNFFNFLPFCSTILTQNWNEHAKAQLITNVCMTCPSNFFGELFSSFLFLTPLYFGVYFVFCNLIDLLMTWWLIYKFQPFPFIFNFWWFSVVHYTLKRQGVSY